MKKNEMLVIVLHIISLTITYDLNLRYIIYVLNSTQTLHLIFGKLIISLEMIISQHLKDPMPNYIIINY